MKYLKYYETNGHHRDKYFVYLDKEENGFRGFVNINSAILYSHQQLNPPHHVKTIGIFTCKKELFTGNNGVFYNTLDNIDNLVKWYGQLSRFNNSYVYNTPEIVSKYLTGVKGYYEDILKFNNPRMILNKIRIVNPKLWDLLKQYVDPNEMDDFANLNELGI